MSKRSILFVFIFLIVIAAASFLFVKGRQAKMQAANVAQIKEEVKKPSVQAGTLLQASQIVFPKILNAAPITESNIPAYLKSFIVLNAVEKSYQKINYAATEQGEQNGIFILYTLKSTAITDAKKQVEAQAGKEIKNWTRLADLSSSVFAFLEFGRKDIGTEMRIIFIQEGGDVVVQVKTLSAKI